MIHAVDALSLPTAALSEEEKQGADRLEVAIEAHVKKLMEMRGVDFSTEEKRPNVIAEVNQRLKEAGWDPGWETLFTPHPLNKAARIHIGFELHMAPSDEAHQQHRGAGSRGRALCANPVHSDACCPSE